MFPNDNETAGLPAADKIVNQFITSVEVKDGAILITFGNSANHVIKGKLLTLRPAVVEDAPVVPITWICGNAAAPDRMTLKGVNKTNDSRFLFALPVPHTGHVDANFASSRAQRGNCGRRYSARVGRVEAEIPSSGTFRARTGLLPRRKCELTAQPIRFPHEVAVLVLAHDADHLAHDRHSYVGLSPLRTSITCRLLRLMSLFHPKK